MAKNRQFSEIFRIPGRENERKIRERRASRRRGGSRRGTEKGGRHDGGSSSIL